MFLYNGFSPLCRFFNSLAAVAPIEYLGVTLLSGPFNMRKILGFLNQL